MFIRILLFYVLSIFLIGLNGTYLGSFISCKHANNTVQSSMELPQSIKCRSNHIAIHDCVYTSRIKYVNSRLLKQLFNGVPEIAASFMNTVVLVSRHTMKRSFKLQTSCLYKTRHQLSLREIMPFSRAQECSITWLCIHMRPPSLRAPPTVVYLMFHFWPQLLFQHCVL